MNTTSFIIYEGPSLLDGSPIVAVAVTKESKNEKTGNMVQTFILRADVEPHEAVKTGQDAAICGDCKHRPSTGGACYVQVFRSPLSVYRAYRRGSYAKAQPADVGRMVAGRMVRLGTYGDPAAVPAQVWEELVAHAQGRTGYTHQWANEALPMAQRETLRRLVMASVDTPDELAQARAQGWRTFRVRLESEPLAQREFMCPASAEAGKRTSCAQCGACDGAERGGKASPVILAHGPVARRFIAIRAA